MTRFLFAAFVTLLLTACSSTPTSPPGPSATFDVPPGQTKVFFYAAYKNPEERPSLDETFILHTDVGDYGDIDGGEFIEMEMPPGPHTFNVEEVTGWGNSESHTTVKALVEPGMPTFIMETIMPDGKAVLSRVDASFGEKDVLARQRKCVCKTAIERLWDSL